MSKRRFMIFITIFEWSIWDTIVTSALYTILGVKYLFSKGHSSLLLRLHPYLVLFEFNKCLLWDDIIDPILGKQLYLIFILFLLNLVYIGWVGGKCIWSNLKCFTYIRFHIHRVRRVVPNNSTFTFSSLICFFYVYIICLLTLITVCYCSIKTTIF